MKNPLILFIAALASAPLLTAKVYYQNDFEAETVGKEPSGALTVQTSSNPETNGGVIIDATSTPANPLPGKSLYIYDLSGADTTNISTRAFLDLDDGKNASNLRVDFDFQRTYAVSPDEPVGIGVGTGIFMIIGRSGDDLFSGHTPFGINFRNNGSLLIVHANDSDSVDYSEQSNHLTLLANSHDTDSVPYDDEILGQGFVSPNTFAVFLNETLVGVYPFGQTPENAPEIDFYAENNDLGQIAFGQWTHSQGGIVFDNMVVQSMTANEGVSGGLINISTRGEVGTGDKVLIGGFVVAGDSPQTVLIRAAGQSLGELGVSGFLADPVLQLFDADGSIITMSDNWGDVYNAEEIHLLAEEIGAFPFDLASTDSVLLTTLEPGSYTAQVRGSGGTTGIALVEIYSVD